MALLSIAACQKTAEAPSDRPATPAASPVAPSAAEAILAEVWQAAHPVESVPSLDSVSAAFDPGFAQMSKAGNDADNAFIKSTLIFIKAVQTADPRFCAEAPLARFRPDTLAAVPSEALPAFRAMLTDRLAVIRDGASHDAPPEDLMSGSMQNFSVALGDGDARDIIASVMAGSDYDPVAGCAATITTWEALDKATQSPQLMQQFYSGQL